MATPTTKTELLKILENELLKQYLVVDPQGRPWLLYSAPHWARTGDPCLVTETLYVDLISSDVLGKHDGYTQWDSSWVPDADFTVADISYSKTQQIITNENEITKSYQEIDVQNRPVRIYEAPVFAADGTPCKVTEYIYQNATSSTIKGKKESYAQWDTTWIPDSAFTVTY